MNNYENEAQIITNDIGFNIARQQVLSSQRRLTQLKSNKRGQERSNCDELLR